MDTSEIDLTVNGQLHHLSLDPRISLLDELGEHLFLHGTKKGCNQGACTILLDGKRINACLTLAVMHNGAHITTIEGLAKGSQLHPLQAAFIAHDAFQCGYCTSGQIISGVACITEGHAHTPEGHCQLNQRRLPLQQIPTVSLRKSGQKEALRSLEASESCANSFRRWLS